VRDGEQKGEVLKTWYSVRNEAAHGPCSCVPSVAWILRFGRAGEGKALCPTLLLKNSISVVRTCGCAEAQEQACGKQATRQIRQPQGLPRMDAVSQSAACLPVTLRTQMRYLDRRWKCFAVGVRGCTWVVRWGVRSAVRGFENDW